MRLQDLPRTIVLVACVLAAGCGDPAAQPAAADATPKAGSAGSDHAGSDAGSGTMNAGLAGAEVEPLDHEEFEQLMKDNNSLMRVIKAAIQTKDKEKALVALEELAENAGRSMGTKPEKNAERLAAYLALFGAQKMTAQGLKGLVELGTWDAMGPSMATLGKNCMTCHKQFRMSPEEKKARLAAGGSHHPTTTSPATVTPKPGGAQ